MLQGKYPLVIATVLGLMAGLIAYSAIMSRTRAMTHEWHVRQVVCAARDIDEGSVLVEDFVTTCELPEKFLTNSFIILDGDADTNAIVPFGEKLIVPLRKGDPILFSNFETRREFPLSEAVSPRYRAMGLELTEQGSVNQMIRPNDHVDILGAFRTEDGKEMVSTTLLQDVIVLATGKTTGTNIHTSDEDRKYTHIVVLLLPEEAELMQLATQSGTLAVTLRNPADLKLESLNDGNVTRYATLFDGRRKGLSPTPRPEPYHLQLPQPRDWVHMIHGEREEDVPASDAPQAPLRGGPGRIR